MTNPYADPEAYVRLPRVNSLTVRGDGQRVVVHTTVFAGEALDPSGALWDLDVTDAGLPPREVLSQVLPLPQSRFLADGRLVTFRSDENRPTMTVLGLADTEEHAWPTGLRPLALAVAGRTVVVLAKEHVEPPGRATAGEAPRQASALMHDRHPTRFWDSELGGQASVLLVGVLTAGRSEDSAVAWRQLASEPFALRDADMDLSTDGRTLVVSWTVDGTSARSRSILVAIDTVTAQHRVIADDRSSDWHRPRISPDGRRVACIRESPGSATEPLDRRLVVLSVDGSEPVLDACPGWNRWATEHVWSSGGDHLFVTADDEGCRPVFTVDLERRLARRVTRECGHYTAIASTSDDTEVHGLRSTIGSPPEPVVIDLATGREKRFEMGHLVPTRPAGTVHRVVAPAHDGTPLHAWLLLPEQGRHAPLVVWLHGGPLHSWNSWSWRGNPWPFVARGYALLLPDPALSTGYGREFVRRGWGAWGEKPYTDVMDLTDAALRDWNLDGTRMAAIGGSFGGYLTNWIAGHTRRFCALVTHAGIWDLEQFVATSDLAPYWARELPPESRKRFSPSAAADRIRTPMLIIHGGKDYRVPMAESLRLWWDLMSRCGTESPHRFLHFPDENHFVEKPQNSVLWLHEVLSFLDRHVCGKG